MVYASSAAIYGNPDRMPISEATAPRPLTAYGADKLGSELHGQVAWLAHGVPTFGCRFFNVYGPRQDPHSPYSGVISIFARRVASGEQLTVNGTGEQVRDFIYVADVVRHLMGGMALLQREPQAAVINVCTGRATSLMELLASLERVCGRMARRSFGPERPGDIRLSLGDPSHATALLGLKAMTRLDQGLAATLGLPGLALAA